MIYIYTLTSLFVIAILLFLCIWQRRIIVELDKKNKDLNTYIKNIQKAYHGLTTEEKKQFLSVNKITN